MKIFKVLFFMVIGAVVTLGMTTIFNGVQECSAAEKAVIKKNTAAVEIEWQTSFAKGLEAAKKLKKPIMVDFYAEWCGWCKKLDKTTYQDKRVLELSKNFVCIKVDTDQDGATSSKYGVRGLPTILFFSQQGEVVNQIVGYGDAQNFITVMNDVINVNSQKKK